MCMNEVGCMSECVIATAKSYRESLISAQPHTHTTHTHTHTKTQGADDSILNHYHLDCYSGLEPASPQVRYDTRSVTFAADTKGPLPASGGGAHAVEGGDVEKWSQGAPVITSRSTARRDSRVLFDAHLSASLMCEKVKLLPHKRTRYSIKPRESCTRQLKYVSNG